jgi:hypothetical protein
LWPPLRALAAAALALLRLLLLLLLLLLVLVLVLASVVRRCRHQVARVECFCSSVVSLR